MMSPRTRLFACAHVSNALGTVLPIRRLIAAAKSRGIATLIDGAQAVPHMAVDVQELGCDFYAFSGHKLFGPTGIGVLYGREALLERMPPWQGGGDMILAVSFDKTTYNSLPYKFEAGTPNISGAIGLGAAVDFLQTLDLEAAHAHEARSSRVCDAHLGEDRRAAHHRHGKRQGEPGILRGGRSTSTRSRHHSRRRRYRDAHRPSLRHARHGILQGARHRPRLVRLLQHLRGNRSACRRHRTCTEDFRLTSTMELNDLYRDVILDHNRRPRNFGPLEPADASVEGFNPMCGDRLTLRLKLPPTKSRHPLRGPGMCDIDCFGFADD